MCCQCEHSTLLRFTLFLIMCAFMCACVGVEGGWRVVPMSVATQGGQKRESFPGANVTGGFESPDIGLWELHLSP